jgi:hypothetical protein
MNAPFLPAWSSPPPPSQRIEVEYLSERYHRAFEEEAEALELLLSRHGDGRLASLFGSLQERLRAHERLQERRLFPAYQGGWAMDRALLEAWEEDTAALSAASAAVLECCDGERPCALAARVVHFVSEVERHLIAEIVMFSAWASR